MLHINKNNNVAEISTSIYLVIADLISRNEFVQQTIQTYILLVEVLILELMVIDSNNFSRIKFVHDELHLMTCKLSCCTCEHTQSCHDHVCVIMLHLVLLSSCHMTSCNLHMVIHTNAHIPPIYPYRSTITSNTGFKKLTKEF